MIIYSWDTNTLVTLLDTLQITDTYSNQTQQVQLSLTRPFRSVSNNKEIIIDYSFQWRYILN